MSFKVVIVTGAASGIGAAIALHFAKQDAGLCITDINEQGLHKIGSEYQKVSKNKVLEVVADLRKDEERENIVKKALEEFGKIDVLVNCAGIFIPTSLQDSNVVEKFDEVFAINLRSVVAMTKHALPALIENKGCIINISSISANLVVREALIYSMTKAGVKIFTKCAALELANLGVRVNSIAPGLVKTKIYRNYGASEDEDNNLWHILTETLPLKKLVKLEEIAELAVYLASDKAASITGSEFVVDAGMMLGSGVNTLDTLHVQSKY